MVIIKIRIYWHEDTKRIENSEQFSNIFCRDGILLPPNFAVIHAGHKATRPISHGAIKLPFSLEWGWGRGVKNAGSIYFSFFFKSHPAFFTPHPSGSFSKQFIA
jgi:hypothetical protein